MHGTYYQYHTIFLGIHPTFSFVQLKLSNFYRYLSDKMDEGGKSPFMFTRAAHIIPTTTATISALSSLLVVTIIGRSWLVRSEIGVYHLIILMMSSSDLISSIPMALTTLPMPADVRQFYPFASKSYGNIATCEAQGFLISFGMNMAMGCTCILCVYYVSVIKYGIMADTFKKRVLPILFSFFFTAALTFSCIILVNDYFNPLLHEPYCLAGPYPLGCKEADGDPDTQECVRGDPSGVLAWSKYKIPYYAAVFLIFATVAASLVSVVWTIASMETERGIENGGIGEEIMDSSDSASRSQTRVVLWQAVMYIAAFVSTWIAYFMTAFASGKGSISFYNTVDPLKVTLMPLQGFFNAGIFIYHEIYAVRKTQKISIVQALRKVLWSPNEVPRVLVSRIELVDADKDDMDQIMVQGPIVQTIQDGDQLSRQESQLSDNEQIGSASIPSDFVSADTPSLDLSLALSENELLKKIGVNSNFESRPGSRSFYTRFNEQDNSISCMHSKVTEESHILSSSVNKASIQTNSCGLDVNSTFPVAFKSDDFHISSACSQISRDLFVLDEEGNKS